MKTKLSYFLATGIFIFCACQNANRNNSADQQIDSTKVVKDASYYQSKGYQVFSEFNLAIKCPCTLEDASKQTPGDNDLAYACIQNENSKEKLLMYQIIIKRLPVGYLNATEAEKKEAEKKLFDTFKGNSERVVFNNVNAVVVNFNEDIYTGKAIAFIKDGISYLFEVITNDLLTQKFNFFTNNIKFIEKAIDVPTSSTTKDSVHSANTNTFINNILSIEYPKNWEKKGNNTPNTILIVVSPYINDVTYMQNFNILVSSDKRTYDEIWVSTKSQMTTYFKGFNLISRIDYTSNNVKGKRTEYCAYLQDFFIHFVFYEFLHKNNYISITFSTDQKMYSSQKHNITEIIKTLKLF